MSSVAVEISVFGPIRRISLMPLEPPHGAQLSVYRVGDVLVDTGGTRVTDALVDALADDPPRRIYLTHQHEDHVGNIAALRAAFGPLAVHAPEAVVDVIAATVRVPPYRAAYWGHPLPIDREDLIPYRPGESFEAAGLHFVAEHSPGHTPPHIALVAETATTIFALTGDLYSSRPLEAFFESATDDTITSYRRLARYGERLCMLPTHGRVRENGASVLSEAADWLEREAEAVLVASATVGTRDPVILARSQYGEDPIFATSQGEIGSPVFVRS
ncbi:MAG: MBL fold metallo-hydrolase, partial [Polyangiaceae bacterium]|nr:MBL fold metallo-hydrolase [Polyangiaceae bacterium]